MEDVLRIFDNTIVGSNMTDLSMKLKTTFTNLTTTLLKAMCQQLAFGQPAVIAKGHLANLQSKKQVFANVTIRAIDLNCGANCTVPTRSVLGSSIEAMYSSYSCGNGNCTGWLIIAFPCHYTCYFP